MGSGLSRSLQETPLVGGNRAPRQGQGGFGGVVETQMPPDGDPRDVPERAIKHNGVRDLVKFWRSPLIARKASGVVAGGRERFWLGG
jgi:hypothetical protein